MGKVFGDEYGMFWEAPVRETSRGPKAVVRRSLPPIPDTGWMPKDHYPDLSSAKEICFDVESNDPHIRDKGPGWRRNDAFIAGIAIGTDDGFRGYYPVAHKSGGNLDKNKVYPWLKEQLSRPNQTKVGMNLLYDMEAVEVECGITVHGPLWDVGIADPILDENHLSYSLESIGQRTLGRGKDTPVIKKWLEEAFGDEDNWKDHIWEAPVQVAGPYGIGDVDLPLEIKRAQLPLLEAQGLMLCTLTEMALLPMLLAMRRRGCPVDVPYAERLGVELVGGVAEVVARIKAKTGVNLGKDLWAAEAIARLFDKEGIKYPRTDPSKSHPNGQPSFRKDWLNHHGWDTAQDIALARLLDKFHGTFVKSYVLEGHVNGRVHTQFHPVRTSRNGAKSYRFASSDPNLQNIPYRDPVWRPKIRGLFVPDQGQIWWKWDWSQLEYRLLVHFAYLMRARGAAEAVQAFISNPNLDYHQMLADFTGLSRRDAKTLNFGLAYGQGVDLLCRNLGVDHARGTEIIDTYHERAPYVRQLQNRCDGVASDRGYIVSLLGYRRRYTAWEDRQGKIHQEPGSGRRRAFTRTAMNQLNQVSNAGIMKKAMAMSWEAGVYEVLGAPYLTVHDELDGGCEDTPICREALAELQEIMRTCVTISVPLKVDGGTGPNWGAIS